MAGADVVQKAAPEDRGGLKIRKPGRRRAVHIDMTPMVDVAFLLLIFFMVTTVFRKPLAMEVNMPEPGAQVKVPEANVMTLLVDRNNTLQYRVGSGPLAGVGWERLFETFTEKSRANPELIVLVKIHRRARYESMVEIMDTLEDAGLERFSVVPMKEEEEPPPEADR